MQFRQGDHEAIAHGAITLTFRRWRRPQARVGGRYRIGGHVIEVTSVEQIDPSDISLPDAQAAGHDSAEAVLDGDELSAITERLARMDARAGHGPWTRSALEAIAAEPGRRAADLAALQGRETAKFKADVRKLKALGLTISLEVGYELSPRGRVVLQVLQDSSET